MVRTMNAMETSEQNDSPLPRLEAKGKGTAGIDLESKAENVCPDCGSTKLRFGSRDPCEGDYYWCRSCGCGPIRFPLNHVMPGSGKTASGPVVVIIGSPFVRTGSIEMVNAALRIDYKSFGEDHSVFIGMMDLQRLVRDRFAPAAPVKQTRQGIDGSEITEKIGYACRTVSGKALKISTSTSGGDMMVPWTSFLQVLNRKIRSATISRIRSGALDSPGPTHASPVYHIQGIPAGRS